MRKTLTILSLLFAFSTLSAAEELVRNPFWPQGYEGQRYAISSAPRHPPRSAAQTEEARKPKLKPGEFLKTVTNSLGVVMQVVESEKKAEAAAPTKPEPKKKTPEELERELWTSARGNLRTSDVLSFEENGRRRQCITINGRVYADGDLVSANCGTNRFTWRVLGVTATGALRLERMKRRGLKENERTNEPSNGK